MGRMSGVLRDDIREQIMRGELRVGDKLPTERELAELHGVSRPVVREALRNLEGAGLLEFRAGAHGGAFLKSVHGVTVAQSINDSLFLGNVTIQEITEARLCILGRAVELAAKRGTKAQFDAIEANIEETEKLLKKDNDDLSAAAIMEYYSLLCAASRNDMFAILIEALSNIVIQIMLKIKPDFVIADFIATRHKILDHLRNQEAALAKEALQKHLLVLHSLIITSSENLYDLNLSASISQRKDS